MRPSGESIESNNPVNWQILKHMLPYMAEFKGRVALALVFMIFAKLATIALPFLLKLIVDGMQPAVGLAEINDAAADTSQSSNNPLSAWLPPMLLAPLALVFAYGLFRFASVAFGEIRDTLFSRVTERTVRRLSLKAFQHLHSLDIAFHLDRRTGGLAREIDRGANGISFIMRFMVFNIIPTLLEISLVVGILLTQYGLAFGLVTASAIFLYISFSVITTNWRSRFVREANQADSKASSRSIDSLLNYETVKYFTNETYESDRYDQDLALWEQAKQKNRLSLFVLNGGQALIISLATTALLYLAVSGVIAGEMTIGDFVLVNAFMMQLFMPLNFLGFIYREIRVALVNIEKMFSLLARKPAVVDQNNALPLEQPKQAIHFDNVSFSYDNKRNILNNISFSIQPGETVAIVGGSGAGKSTLVKMLLRFYDPNNGAIRIGEQNIAQISQLSLREHIGVVPQDTVLFNDSILQNVRYGDPDASDSAVKEAIRLAHLDPFIEQLPEGLETQVGERGLKVSGGEKQRLAIARALLKQPPIMIFDEATSSLDSHSEAAILGAINEIAGQHTSLMIAHRLSTIINADKIIVLDHGKLVESGTHDELLKHAGHYAKLWQAQQKNSN